MRRLQSKVMALLGVAAIIVTACGSSATTAADPVGGMSAAFETAKSGGILKQFELVTCLSAGGGLGSSFSGMFGGMTEDVLDAAGITADELSAAWKLSFSDIKTSEVSRSGDRATVHVTVKVTSEVDAGRLRDLIKKYGATQGIIPDDATIDAAIQARLGGQMTMSETIDKDISVSNENGQWIACGSTVGTTAGGASPNAGNTASPSEAATASEAPSAEVGAPTPTDTPSGSGVPSASGDAIAITAGTAHNCALLSNGGIKCWGTNSSGQLGNGTTDSSAAATYVAGLTAGVKAISGWASTYTCALTNGGGVKCWGSGAVGNGSKTPTLTPQDVVGLTSGVEAISAGFNHACAITSDGGVSCWGNNAVGQFGDGSTTSSSVPVKVPGLTEFTGISAGESYTCAISSAGGVKCWGQNNSGQLGNGSTTASLVPVDVAGLTSGVRAVAAGAGYTCALMDSGGVKCWGGGSAIPTDIAGSEDATAIYPPIQIACASMSGGGLKCWTGQDPAAKGDPNVPTDAMALAYGSQTTFCLLLASGGVVCVSGSSLVPVAGLDAGSAGTGSDPATATSGNTVAIAIGFQHGCAINAAGGLRCWGQNGDGQLGTGSTGSSDNPVDVFGLSSGVTAVDAGFGVTCAVTSAGAVKCWGRNAAGQLGSGTTANSLIPVDVTGLASEASTVTLGSSHSCALSTAGAVRCWGDNGARQLGNGTATSSLVPTGVTNLSSGIKAIDARETLTCAVTAAGGVKCWGTGMTGNGLAGNASLRNEVPADVVGLTGGVAAVALGSKHACVLTTGGGVKCWGGNQHGELGTGTNGAVFPYVPADVTGLSGVKAIAAGATHTCVLTSGGGVKCWGNNSSGQLGNGTTVNSNTPIDVAGLASGIKLIRAGDDSTCAIMSGGAVKCWGGAFGTSPADVAGL